MVDTSAVPATATRTSPTARPQHARYLAVLWCLEEAGVRATRSRIASSLGVWRPSVGAAVRALHAAGHPIRREADATPSAEQQAA